MNSTNHTRMFDCGDIYIRKLQTEDEAFYQSLYADTQLMTYIGDVQDRESAQKYFHLTLKYMAQNPPSMLLFVLCKNNNNERIGVVGIRWNQDSKDAVEIGVIIAAKYHRQGHAHVAKQRIIQHAFEDLSIARIVANCDQDNMPANRANKKLGFSQQQVFMDPKRDCAVVRWQMDKGEQT